MGRNAASTAANAPGPLAGTGVALMKEALRLKRVRWSNLEEDLVVDGELEDSWRLACRPVPETTT